MEYQDNFFGENSRERQKWWVKEAVVNDNFLEIFIAQQDVRKGQGRL